MVKKNGIPDRWIPYKPVGSVIPGTKFIACKVPLKEEMLRKLPGGVERFGPEDLIRAYPKIGLLIDLTNTARYYNKQDFTDKNIQYEKIFCPGHVVPPNSIVKKFFAVVDNFLANQRDPNLLIVVHCTHGVNRTGYFICRYMIQKMKIAPEVALKSFEEGRGYKIERQNYIEDLKNGCKGGSESTLKFTPGWKVTKTTDFEDRVNQNEVYKANNYSRPENYNSKRIRYEGDRSRYEGGRNQFTVEPRRVPDERGHVANTSYNNWRNHGPYQPDDYRPNYQRTPLPGPLQGSPGPSLPPPTTEFSWTPHTPGSGVQTPSSWRLLPRYSQPYVNGQDSDTTSGFCKVYSPQNQFPNPATSNPRPSQSTPQSGHGRIREKEEREKIIYYRRRGWSESSRRPGFKQTRYNLR